MPKYMVKMIGNFSVRPDQDEFKKIGELTLGVYAACTSKLEGFVLGSSHVETWGDRSIRIRAMINANDFTLSNFPDVIENVVRALNGCIESGGVWNSRTNQWEYAKDLTGFELVISFAEWSVTRVSASPAND